MRKLAEGTENSAKEVADIINGMVSDINEMTRAAEHTAPLAIQGADAIIQAQDGFTRIAGTVDEILSNAQAALMTADNVNSIAGVIDNTMREIVQLTTEAAHSVQNVAAASQEMTSQSEEVSASAAQLGQIARTLQTSVNRFKV